VLVGTACASPQVAWWRAAAALAVVLALQVGVSYANGRGGGGRGAGGRGLGAVGVFVLFGFVATAGSAYVQTGPGGGVPPLAVAAAVPVGALATALLVATNLRDLPADAEAGRRTLAVRLGDRRTRWLYVTLLAAGVTAPINMSRAEPRVLVALLVLPLAARAAARVLRGAGGADLVAVLGETERLQLAFGVLLAAGLWRR
jgi:1,4-dihydroxy-2-naphthoate octaprenyltransferase